MAAMMTTKNTHPSSLAGIAVVSVLCWASLGVSAAQPVSNNSVGISKGQIRALSADWWQWALSIPEAVHPLAFVGPQSADYCGVGQHGDVWFLGGVIATTPVDPIQGTVVRTCVVPHGTAIFFPVINAECSVIEGNGTTERDLRQCAKDLMDHVTEVEASVDGVALRNLGRTRVQSDLFSFTLPPGDQLGLFGTEPNPSASVSDGFWVLLPPLSDGAHTVKFRGVAPFPEFDFVFKQDITYDLTVVPPPFQ
jgi:hypothetical protein